MEEAMDVSSNRIRNEWILYSRPHFLLHRKHLSIIQSWHNSEGAYTLVGPLHSDCFSVTSSLRLAAMFSSSAMLSCGADKCQFVCQPSRHSLVVQYKTMQSQLILQSVLTLQAEFLSCVLDQATHNMGPEIEVTASLPKKFPLVTY